MIWWSFMTASKTWVAASYSIFCGRDEPLVLSERQLLAQMSKFTNHRAISLLFFCRAYFPPVYWARHKTHAEPKVGRSQNGTASNRENLPQSSLTLASAILDGIKGHFSAKLPTRNKAVSSSGNTNVISR
jgi:hypothetical protein